MEQLKTSSNLAKHLALFAKPQKNLLATFPQVGKFEIIDQSSNEVVFDFRNPENPNDIETYSLLIRVGDEDLDNIDLDQYIIDNKVFWELVPSNVITDLNGEDD